MAKLCCWAMLFYLQGLQRGQHEVISLDPLPSVSANIPRGLQLRFCFSSLADVCFNLIKWFTSLNVWMKALVGPRLGGGGRGEVRACGHQVRDAEASSPRASTGHNRRQERTWPGQGQVQEVFPVLHRLPRAILSQGSLT